MRVNLVVGVPEADRPMKFQKFPHGTTGIDFNFCPALQKCDVRVRYKQVLFNWSGEGIPTYLKKILKIRVSSVAARQEDDALEENGEVFMGGHFCDQGVQYIVRYIDPKHEFVRAEPKLNAEFYEDDDSEAELETIDYEVCRVQMLKWYQLN